MDKHRYLYNRAIVRRLTELVDMYPDMRFHQLLWNVGLIEYRPTAEGELIIEDRYNEESQDTWEGMIDNSFCFPPRD